MFEFSGEHNTAFCPWTMDLPVILTSVVVSFDCIEIILIDCIVHGHGRIFRSARRLASDFSRFS